MTVIFIFLNAWNEFLFALTFTLTNACGRSSSWCLSSDMRPPALRNTASNFSAASMPSPVVAWFR